ncbi:hypothetical protein [Halopenitus persicus]|uniref:hypothetical protein n=1 Tax=Halopenitus persicus TaxID=1048396 RepID=UPI0012FD865B|nr:hypothetical protein [Halopenitus persicus]
MSPTRRQFLLGSTGGITAIAGCAALSDPEQSLLISVHNYTDSRHEGALLIENGDTVVARQYMEVAGAPPDEWTTVETEIALGKMPTGTRLDVTASFGDGHEQTESITLDCHPEYTGDAIFVQFEPERPTNPQLRNVCYDEFPSAETFQGDANQS